MINCLLVDDEPLALRLLEKYVGRSDELRLVGAYSSANEAMDCMERGGVDLAFLDIQMPGMNGIELARVARQHSTKVVFVTAYRDFALEGFRVAALDYLLKPVNYAEFCGAVERYKELAVTAEPVPAPVADTMMVKSDYRTVPVRFSDVLYVEGLKDYVKIHIEGRDRPLLTQTSLKSLEATLPAESFVRIHRSFIVALERVESFGRTQVKIGSVDIPVGDTYRARFLARMGR